MKIQHIAIWCRDVEMLRRFYETYFEAKSNEKYVNSSKEFESYFLNFDSGASLEIMHKPTIPATTNDPHKQFTGLVHLAFSVGSEQRVDELTDELNSAGYEIIDGPRRTGDGCYESVVLDPENNRIEITV